METVASGSTTCVTNQAPAVVGHPDLGNAGSQHRLTMRAEERAVGVLADPLALKQAGTAVPLLAVVNERCGDGESCRLKYADVAARLDVSVTTVKTWAESLGTLGYFTREACGPAGVEIRLCAERWPGRGGTALVEAVNTVARVIDAVRVTVNRALESATAEVRRVGEVRA